MILFGTHDAGPAKYLAVVINEQKHGYGCLCSPIAKDVMDSNGVNNLVPVEIAEHLSGIDAGGIELIVTGTSWGGSLDRELIKFGIRNSKKVISVIEHWSWYRERFLEGNELILPHFIIVNDEIAKREAIEGRTASGFAPCIRQSCTRKNGKPQGKPDASGCMEEGIAASPEEGDHLYLGRV